METTQKVKVYLNMILKEDEPAEMVERSIQSVLPYVDDAYITVTYKENEPTPKSPLIKLLTQMNVKVSTFKWVYDFAAARNAAMDKVPHGSDCYIYWQDADDVLQRGENLHKVAEDAFNMNHASIYFDYWYIVDVDEEGNIREILVNHKRERLIRNDNSFKWIGKLHETLIQQAEENIIKIARDDCTVVHLSDDSRMDANIGRNIEILEEAAKEEQHKDPRTLIYLAKAYFDKAKMSEMPERKIYLDLALTLFHEYLEGFGQPGQPGYSEGSGWREERATAWQYIGEIAIILQNLDIAIQAFHESQEMAPEFPLYSVNLAMAYASKGEYKKAKSWLAMGMALDEPDTTIITTPRDLKTRALETSFQINMAEGKIEQALEDTAMLLKIIPNDSITQERMRTMSELVKDNKVCQSIVYIGKYLEENNEFDKLEALVKSIPDKLQVERFAAEMRHRFLPPKKWESNEIAILCGPGFETWSPKSVATGIGGSEEAVVYLSQELTKLGWKVTVYANPGEDAGDHDGVTYKTWWDLNAKDDFNALILWRYVGFVDFNPKAKFTMLWLHDVPNNPDYTQERIDKIDKIAVLSEYHKSLLRMKNAEGEFEPIPDSKILLTANGVSELKVPEKWEGNPHRMIYASSPDRGLPYLLNMWPKVLEAVPDAELHVFYGFHVFDAIYANNPSRMKWKQYVMDMMKQPGIVYHGRVGHEQLHEEYAKSGIWAYPTDFTEISCISAMKAQMLGAIPVCTTVAALEETVKNGVKVDVDITTEEGQEEYVKALIDTVTNEDLQNEIRPNMIKFARNFFSWSNVAKSWDELMRIKLESPDNVHVVSDKLEELIQKTREGDPVALTQRLVNIAEDTDSRYVRTGGASNAV